MTEVSKIDSEITQLSRLDSAQLKGELAKSLKITADQLLRLAAIVRVLEERGENLDDLKLGMIGYLRKIAYGQLRPGLVVQLQGAPMLLSRASSLPLPDQDKIVSGEPIKVSEMSDDGKTTHRMVPPLLLGRDQILQVFGREQIRNEDAQLRYLRERMPRRRTPDRPADADSKGVVVDRRRRGIKVGDVFLSQAELAQYLARISD